MEVLVLPSRSRLQRVCSQVAVTSLEEPRCSRKDEEKVSVTGLQECRESFFLDLEKER